MAPIETGKLDLVERLTVIRRQEEEMYACIDYLSPDFQAELKHRKLTDVQAQTTSLKNNSYPSMNSSLSEGINEVWREMMCEWIFQIIDYHNYNREVASVALNYFDRYLCKHYVDKEIYQLLGITSLFLAIKMNVPNPLTMKYFIKLSRCRFNMDQISAMENSMLWYVL